ncbi:MAG: YhcH/YjgK/YiaL family protein [Cohnella sp.]|nr:YhcH/YjgK/YiaL family protein [Cohnella sp.]
MILGSLSSWKHEIRFLTADIAAAVEELVKLSERNPEPGKIEMNGDKMYATVMEFDAKPLEEQVAEKHEQYVDVHYLFEGEETIGWFPQRDGLDPFQAYDSDADYMLYAPADDEVLLKLKPGMFAVFYPHDIHRPGMGKPSARIKKAVVKVRIE